MDAVRIVAVRTEGLAPVELLSRVHPDALRRLRALAPSRVREWLGGRLCRALAAEQTLESVTDPRTSPWEVRPGRWSVSHKVGVCVAASAVDPAVLRVGVDVEVVQPSDVLLATKILTPSEVAIMSGLDDEARPGYVSACFSAKEAIWKALTEEEQRDLGYREICPIVDHTGPMALGHAPAGRRAITFAQRSESGWILTVAADLRTE